MRWLEVSVAVDGEGAEAVHGVLSLYGRGGAVVEEVPEAGGRKVTVKAYVPLRGKGIALRRRIERALWHLSQLYPVPAPQFRVIEEEDWMRAWREHFQAIRIGQRWVVKPTWRDYEPSPGDVVIELDPGMAFGTGLHPTTRLCLEALERLSLRGKRVLDVGTGSGILAIAAARLGAREVLALDVDQMAVEVARRNVLFNGVETQVRVEWGSPLPSEPGCPRTKLEPNGWDLILANILAEVIVEMAGELAVALSPGGLLISSGIVAGKEGEVLTAFKTRGLALRELRREEDWLAVIAEKGPHSEQETAEKPILTRRRNDALCIHSGREDLLHPSRGRG